MSTHKGTLLDRPAVYPAADRVHRLVAGGSELGVQLARALDVPLRDYLRELVPAPQSHPNAHRLRLARAVETYLHSYGDADVDATCDHLLRVPVIQQADHASLLLDAETFLHNYLFHVACREAGVTVALVNQCTTVSCLVRRTPVLGPTFLRSRGGLFGVYPFSKTVLKNSSFCGLPGPLEMAFEPLEGTRHDVASDPVLGPLIGLKAPDAPTAYRMANNEIWAGLDLDHGVRRVQIDEAVVSECVALHVEDPASPVFALLFDPAVRDAFLRAKRHLVADPSNLAVNNASPTSCGCARAAACTRWCSPARARVHSGPWRRTARRFRYPWSRPPSPPPSARACCTPTGSWPTSCAACCPASSRSAAPASRTMSRCTGGCS
ncbi:hypothetical protein Pflav_085950 [Phytohabitans flavus]|uniref:Uncharacterized protein n=1 Tax=Phytohabitans flavus TaxID=1076124 RepID=A0A6F8Y7W6_9ACTN|nr:hypothetical protein [Phytohabitans flavus]BCB82185.1 hypothetical protein Pflav_085950 [Phytohabitans flavus]